MHYKIKDTKIGKLIKERNNALLIICGLFLVTITQSITLFQLMGTQKNHFTPLPRIITQPFSISRKQISAGYLADMTRYFAMLRLNYTPATINEQASILLRYTDSAFYGAFKEILVREIDKAKDHDISLSFSPLDTKVDTQNKTVWIEGDLMRFVGKTRLNVKRVKYRVSYSYDYGELRVTGMQAISEVKHG